MQTGGDPFVELLDAARIAEAAGERARERWLRHQVEEGATLTGTLLDLAERGIGVTVQTSTGHTVTGILSAVGRDFCALSTTVGRTTCVALSAVTSVRVEPTFGPLAAASGDRPPPLDLSLGEVMARVAPERPHVRVVTNANPPLVASCERSGPT